MYVRVSCMTRVRGVCVRACVRVCVCECVDGLTKKWELFVRCPMTPIRGPSPDILQLELELRLCGRGAVLGEIHPS